LFRRDEEAIDHWSVNNVRLCSQRQQRILADVWPALKKNGILIYATCSYSREEDEDVVKWITSEYSAEVVKLKIEESWGIVESSGGYRFWPDKIKGEGFFMSCLKKTEGDDEINMRSKKRIDRLSKREKEIVKPWVKETTSALVNIGNMIYALPPDLLDDIDTLVNTLHLTYAGIRVGEFVREKLLPDHALAMSSFVSKDIERIELAYDDAIAYLRRAELKDIDIKSKGWVLVCYQGHALGWINVLQNRINNYYPKELRILKDFNQAERE
jgi:NOL1/NOP2/fmu family ribosome biogenesis protein